MRGIGKRDIEQMRKKKNEKTGLGNENGGGFDKVCVLFLVAFGLPLPILENFFQKKKIAARIVG